MRKITKILFILMICCAQKIFSSEIENLSLSSIYGTFSVVIDAFDCHYNVVSVSTENSVFNLSKAYLLCENEKNFYFNNAWKSNSDKVNFSYLAESQSEKKQEYNLLNSQLFSKFKVEKTSSNSKNYFEKIYIPFESDFHSQKVKIQNSYLILVLSSQKNSGETYILKLKIDNSFIKNEKNIIEKMIYTDNDDYPSFRKRGNFRVSKNIVPFYKILFYLSEFSDTTEYTKACNQYARLLKKSVENETEYINGKPVWAGANLINYSDYFREYISYLESRQYPLYTAKISELAKNFNPLYSVALSDAEAQKIAEKSQFYLSSCVEYYLKSNANKEIFSNKFMEKVKKSWLFENENYEFDFYPEIENPAKEKSAQETNQNEQNSLASKSLVKKSEYRKIKKHGLSDADYYGEGFSEGRAEDKEQISEIYDTNQNSSASEKQNQNAAETEDENSKDKTSKEKSGKSSEEIFFTQKGNPMPYVKNGIDTPRTFFAKMNLQGKSQKKQKYGSGKFISSYNYKSFIPGLQSNEINAAGSDSFGMFTACIFMAGLDEFFYSYNGKPAKNLKSYSENIASLSSKNSGTLLDEYSPNSRLSIEDLEICSYMILNNKDIRKGDILLKNKDGKQELCIVTGNVGDYYNGPENIEVVALSEKTLVAKKCLWSELEDLEYYCPRRLVCIKNSNSKLECADVLDTKVFGGRLSFESIKENEQADDSYWRWIPNTGEWLELLNPEIYLTNLMGMEIVKSFENPKENVEIEFGLRDRNFYERRKRKDINDDYFYQNITNNSKDGKFHFAFETTKGSMIIYGTFYNNGTGKYELKKEYSLGKITLNNYGELEVNGQKIVKFYIRPYDFKSAKPGDDVLLYINLKNNNKIISIESLEKDYMAVYDKKLLWRANLYLNQNEYNSENTKHGVDWNDLHKWNVPPSMDCVKKFDDLWWWDSSWGFNEWNRIYDGTQNVSNISNLKIGNGGQTVVFQEFTPHRTVTSNTELPTQKNKINRTVAYSYPIYKYDIDDSEGNKGSMDSPFDFLWKLNQQYESRKKKFSATWTTKENRWKNYKNSQSGKNISQSFLPGLGLYYFDYCGINKNTNTHAWLEKDVGKLELENNFEAGTDCIGFAQRCASYSGNNYIWNDLPKGIMENTTNDYQDVLKFYGTKQQYRTYPNNLAETKAPYCLYGGRLECAEDILYLESAGDFKDAKFEESVEEELVQKLRCIVPGDIFVKASTVESYKKYGLRSHIAIVASVPENSTELSAKELMEKITLIESTYAAWAQSVVKVFSLADYYNKKSIEKVELYGHEEQFGFNCYCFAVRRLLTKS